jgi:ATP-dependent DNA helicase RecQ
VCRHRGYTASVFAGPQAEQTDGPSSDADRARRLMHDVLGHERLQPGQREAIDAVLDGRDTLAVMATGSGKSAIYQTCGAAIAGSTIVISPLIALQRDQVASLAETNAGTPLSIDSTLSTESRRTVLDTIGRRDAEFVFLAPEQLANPETFEAVLRSSPSLVVVDEAHCVSEWGQDFRPAYRDLGGLIDQLGHPTVLALTATASPPVRDDIIEALRMSDPVVIVRGFDRPNIHLSVVRHVEAASRDEAVVAAAASLEGQGIIYTATRRRTAQFARALAKRRRVGRYHGGMKRSERDAAHDAFTADEIDVMVATNAFGMGIDKADVRWVLHADAPQSLDEYYQEIGRAGRDGRPAEAVLFYRPEDVGRQRFHAGSADDEEHRLARSRLETLRTFWETTACRRSLVLSYLGEPFDPPCGRCDNCDKGKTGASDQSSHPYAAGSVVLHRSWGRGTVMQADAGQLTVLFDSVGYRNLSTDVVEEEGLLVPASPAAEDGRAPFRPTAAPSR